MRASTPPEQTRSVSVELGILTDSDTDWRAIDRHLDSVGANAVDLSAGRVEFTAFDWEAYPDAAAEAGTDHISVAARALNRTAQGTPRQIGLIVDAYIPNWIADDPSVAGVAADGTRATYTASAYQLARGAVGDRLVEYVAALGERYDPAQIAVTELFLDIFSFGADDLALYQEMTGEGDWPRTEDGVPDESDPRLGTWRSEVLAGLLARMRSALDEVRGGEGAQILLAMDARIDWEDPAAGDRASGHDYTILLRAADRLILWGYVFLLAPEGTSLPQVTADLAAAGYDMSRFTMSVGLWSTREVPPEMFGAAVASAETNGITHVNVTPLSLMSDADWDALAAVWNPASPSPS